MRSAALLISTFILSGSILTKEHRCWVGGEIQGKEFQVQDLEVNEDSPDRRLAEQKYMDYNFRLQYTPENSRFPYPAKLRLTISKQQNNEKIELFSSIWLDGYVKISLPNQEGYIDFKCFLNEE